MAIEHDQRPIILLHSPSFMSERLDVLSPRVTGRLEPIFAAARSMAAAEIFLEIIKLSERGSPWGIHNSPLSEYEAYFGPVLPASLDELIVDTREKHGTVVALQLGSNNDPLADKLVEGDVSIVVGLQDLHTEEQMANDRENERYFVAGSLATPEAWEEINNILTSLHERGQIPSDKANFILGRLIGGWRAFPFRRKMTHATTDRIQLAQGQSKSGNIDKEAIRAATELDKRLFRLYTCWFANQVWNVLDEGGIALLDLPRQVDKQFVKWVEGARSEIHVRSERTARSPYLHAVYVEKEAGDPNRLPQANKG